MRSAPPPSAPPPSALSACHPSWRAKRISTALKTRSSCSGSDRMSIQRRMLIQRASDQGHQRPVHRRPVSRTTSWARRTRRPWPAPARSDGACRASDRRRGHGKAGAAEARPSHTLRGQNVVISGASRGSRYAHRPGVAAGREFKAYQRLGRLSLIPSFERLA